LEEKVVKITTVKEDNDLVKQGIRPNYVVVSEQVGAPFISAEMAIKWHNYVRELGVETIIMDLTDYDWDVNPANFQLHNISTEEGLEKVGMDLIQRNQKILN
jgi:hypothetical protein